VPPSPSPVPTPASPSGPATLDFTSQFGAALVGAARREGGWQNEARRRSTLFLSTDAGDEDGSDSALGAGAPPGPRLRHSKSIDEGMFSAEPYLRLESAGPGAGYAGYGAGSRAYGGSSAFTSFLPPRPLVHPLTGKALDPASPLGLALAARERALKESSEGGGAPQPPPRPPSPRPPRTTTRPTRTTSQCCASGGPRPRIPPAGNWVTGQGWAARRSPSRPVHLLPADPCCTACPPRLPGSGPSCCSWDPSPQPRTPS
jgi:hypothetical protein